MSSIPCLKVNPSSTASPSFSSYPSTTKPRSYRPLSLPLRIRCSQTDQGPLRRPVSPPARQPSLSPPPSLKPTPPSPPPPPSTSPPPPPPPVTDSAETAVESGVKGVTLEFQRQKAKELQAYFKQKKLEEASQGPFFGFVGKNEISNGRWAMFGFAVGMLTEYATGSDFVDQVKILLSNFGILDLD